MSSYQVSPCDCLIDANGVVVGILGIDGRQWSFPAAPVIGAEGAVTVHKQVTMLFDATNTPVGYLVNRQEFIFSTPFTLNTNASLRVRHRSLLINSSGQPQGVRGELGSYLFPVPPTAAGGGGSLAYDIVLLAGQSNMSGRGVVDATLDAPTAYTFEYGGYSADGAKYQLITQAVDPLDHPDQGAGLGQALGPGTSFARQYFANTGRRVLLIPVAFGGTGLTVGNSNPTTWSPYGSSNTQYLFALSQANAAIAAAQLAFPGSKFVATLWIQGEADSAVAITQAAYQQALYDLITNFRAGITGAASTPFILGQMLPEAISLNSGPSGAGTGTYPAIDAAHTAVAAGIAMGGKTIVGSGFNTSGDNLHYGAVGIRLMGTGMANGVLTALASAGDATPAQLTGLTAGTPTSSSIPMTWTAVSGARSYTVQYSTDGVTWSTVGSSITNISSLTNSVNVIGLSAGTAYFVRARANAYGSTPNGAWSTSATATTASALADAFVQLTSITGTHITQSGSSGVGWTYTSTTGGTYTTDHAGTSNLSMPAGVLGSLRASVTTPSTGQWILALVTTQSDPVYSAGATGYKFGIIASNTGNYKVIVDGGSSTVVGNGTVVAEQSGDIVQLVRADATGTILAQVARAASPTTFVTIHTFAAKSTAALWAAVSPNASATVAIGPIIGNGWA